MPDAVILVPRRAGDPVRDRLWEFVRPWWEQNVGLPIFEGHHDVGPFNRSAAVNTAAALAGEWDVAIIIDGDVLVGPDQIGHAIAHAVGTGGPALAYTERVHLNHRGTEKVLAGYRGNWRAFKKTVHFDSCSSAYVVRRDLWDEVGGFDPLFSGWGWEDVAFRCATETIAGQELHKVDGTLWHLFHRPSHENNPAEGTFRANRARGARYNAARFDRERMADLLEEARTGASRLVVDVPAVGPIPRRLIRTVPRETSDEVEAFWQRFTELHPGWDLVTFRDPIDEGEFPITAPHWDRCSHPAQMAGLVRLEALWNLGGIYVDSDVEPYRPFDALLGLSAFAGWEDGKVVPDAVLGAPAKHPAIGECLELAIAELDRGPWASGPGVTTSVLPWRPDVVLFPPGTFYPYHYREKDRRHEDHAAAQPWAFAAHHWHGSWVPK